MPEQPRIIVGGFLGLLEAGGTTWDYVQYPLGFAELGCDVYYLEDTGLWPVFQEDAGEAVSCSRNVSLVQDIMTSFGLADRWAYRDAVTNETFGMSTNTLREVCNSADIFVNISCSTVMRDEYQAIPMRALIDSDPMFTQMQYVTETAFTPGESSMRNLVHAHTHHFTFGENIGAADCRVPRCGIDWRPTRQPICLGHWPYSDPPKQANASYSTVMNWSVVPPVQFEGEAWGQKNVEFERLLTLPRLVEPIALAVAVGQTSGTPFPTDQAQRNGWSVLNPQETVPDWRSYRSFIQSSRGELSVAKETYVKARTGWFSGRSACYLASGRPVVTQDTAWSRYIPTGAGLFAFDDATHAAEVLARIEAEPAKHARAARAVAEDYFDSAVVLAKFLEQLMD